MADLATAYLKLVPSLQGAQKTIESELGGISDRAGRSAGASMGGGILGGMESSLGKASGAIGGMASKIGGLVSGAVSRIGPVMAAGTAAAAAGVAAIGKAALDSYKDYEQLSGGVDKLYGESADKLRKFAQEAYKTSGMDANTYMEQATSFSAALVNSLGGDTAKAADQTDVAMRAISDNVNTFGSDMSSVQNAFQGFAKQNYTMLDNLSFAGALAA